MVGSAKDLVRIASEAFIDKKMELARAVYDATWGRDEGSAIGMATAAEQCEGVTQRQLQWLASLWKHCLDNTKEGHTVTVKTWLWAEQDIREKLAEGRDVEEEAEGNIMDEILDIQTKVAEFAGEIDQKLMALADRL